MILIKRRESPLKYRVLLQLLTMNWDNGAITEFKSTENRYHCLEKEVFSWTVVSND